MKFLTFLQENCPPDNPFGWHSGIQRENGRITTAEIVMATQANLVNKGVLTPFVALSVFAVAGLTAQQVICTLNPFCYLSHLSAMEWHHLTPYCPCYHLHCQRIQVADRRKSPAGRFRIKPCRSIPAKVTTILFLCQARFELYILCCCVRKQ